jgi:hypothetical protein
MLLNVSSVWCIKHLVTHFCDVVVKIMMTYLVVEELHVVIQILFYVPSTIVPTPTCLGQKAMLLFYVPSTIVKTYGPYLKHVQLFS